MAADDDHHLADYLSDDEDEDTRRENAILLELENNSELLELKKALLTILAN
jgi:hypothetical protein